MAVIIDHTNRRVLDVLENRDQATVTADFQKARADGLLAARRELQRELPKDEAQKLKGSRWLWAKNFENLTAEERPQLSDLRTQFPTLARLADQREA